MRPRRSLPLLLGVVLVVVGAGGSPGMRAPPVARKIGAANAIRRYKLE